MSGLLGFIVSMILLLGVGAIFFLTIDGIAKDALLAKIAKIAVGCILLIAFILSVAAVLGLGGSAFAASPGGIITFAIGVLVLLAVLYIVDLILGWIGSMMGVGEPIVTAVRYIITVIALICLLLLAAAAMLKDSGGKSVLPGLGPMPNILAPERK
jgi:hypothetical protein